MGKNGKPSVKAPPQGDASPKTDTKEIDSASTECQNGNRLSEGQKEFIVQRLACFRTPTEVVNEFNEEFPENGLDLNRQWVNGYDPYKRGGSIKWKELYDATRAAYLDSVGSIGVSNIVYRQEVRQELLRYLLKGKTKNTAEVRAILREAAEDMGGAYTNFRNLSLKDADASLAALAALLGVAKEELP